MAKDFIQDEFEENVEKQVIKEVKEEKKTKVKKAAKLDIPKVAIAKEYKFVKVVRKGPSFHTVLLEDGSKVRIHKSKIDVRNKVIKE